VGRRLRLSGNPDRALGGGGRWTIVPSPKLTDPGARAAMRRGARTGRGRAIRGKRRNTFERSSACSIVRRPNFRSHRRPQNGHVDRFCYRRGGVRSESGQAGRARSGQSFLETQWMASSRGSNRRGEYRAVAVGRNVPRRANGVSRFSGRSVPPKRLESPVRKWLCAFSSIGRASDF
jgi:hypothetical protein